MPCLKTSCCGFTLKDGTLLIGYITVIGGMFTLGAAASKVFPEIENEDHSKKIGLILVCSVTIILSTMLIIGTTKANGRLLLPWIALIFIEMIIAAIILIDNFIFNPKFSTNIEKNIMTGVLVVFVYGLVIYLLLIVISHYQELAAAGMGERNNLLPMQSTPNQMSSYASTAIASHNVLREDEQ